MSLSGKRVLVTGAGGFIGSHLVERLVHAGARTRALVRYNSAGLCGWLDKLPIKEELEIVAGDIRDGDTLRPALRDVDIVFHLAALIGIPYSYNTPLGYMRTNVEGTLNVLQAALDAGVELVVHTSTSEVYGSACYVPIDEDHPLQGQSPYSASKIGADKVAEAFHRSFGLPVTTIRPFNTFGPRQSARAIIPTIITQALMQPAVHLGSLDPTRDFTYVADIVEGFTQIAECSEAIGQVINVGSGQEISIGDLATRVLTILGCTTVPVVCDRDRVRPQGSEVQRLCAAVTRAHHTLGWAPHHSLNEGLTKTVEWISDNLVNYKSNLYSI